MKNSQFHNQVFVSISHSLSLDLPLTDALAHSSKHIAKVQQMQDRLRHTRQSQLVPQCMFLCSDVWLCARCEAQISVVLAQSERRKCYATTTRRARDSVRWRWLNIGAKPTTPRTICESITCIYLPPHPTHLSNRPLESRCFFNMLSKSNAARWMCVGRPFSVVL